MTEVQAEKLRQVQDILGEHFDAAVVVVLAQQAQGEDVTNEDYASRWTKNLATTNWLLEVGKAHVMSHMPAARKI